MFNKHISVLVILVGVFCCIQIQAFRQPTCRGKETKLSEDELKVMTDCMKEFGGNGNMTAIPKDKMGCVGKCIMKRQGMVDPKGIPMKDNIFAMVNATMEPEVAKEADEKLGKCIDEKSSGIDVNEKACKTYWPLVQCIATAFVQICATNSTHT